MMVKLSVVSADSSASDREEIVEHFVDVALTLLDLQAL
jgi:hypothetical protein